MMPAKMYWPDTELLSVETSAARSFCAVTLSAGVPALAGFAPVSVAMKLVAVACMASMAEVVALSRVVARALASVMD